MIRYESDPYNRLVIETPGERRGRKSGLKRHRKVLDGRFRTNKKNELTYHVKAPFPRGAAVPHQLKLKGRWSLTEKHDLLFALDKSARRTFGDRITLRGDIVDVKKDALLYAVTTASRDGRQTTYLIKLGGAWQADANNRLTFHATREKGRHDILTLVGAWEINKDHEIIYRYEKASLIRKKKSTHTLTFRGHWDIRKKGRISYLVGGSSDSAFDFAVKAAAFKGNYIRYEAGIGVAGRPRQAHRTITLHGKWNFKRGAGAFFEVQYEGARTKAIVFGVEGRMTDRETVVFKLKNNRDNKDIGATLEVSRKLLKADGEAFVRLAASGRETAVYAGAAGRW